MTQIDRYFFLNMIGPFFFFAMILTCVTWLAQSLRIIDLIINHGQSIMILLEFAILILPVAMSIVLPISALAGILYGLNRLMNDSELVVIFAAGQGRLRALRAMFVYSIFVSFLLAVVTLYLMPTSSQTLKTRTAEIRADLVAALIKDGQFLHPVQGVTVYLRNASASGQMQGVIFHDARDLQSPVATYAQDAYIDESGETPKLVMLDGSGHSINREENSLTVADFDRAIYDLSSLMERAEERRRRPSEYYFYDLITPEQYVTSKREYNKFLAEGHEQLSAPLYGFAMPVLATALLLGGSFSRRGYGGRIAIAAIACAGLRLVGLAVKNMVSSNGSLWPFLYLLPLLGGVVGVGLLVFDGHKKRRKMVAYG